MLSASDQNVLDAVAHSLEFEPLPISGAEGADTLHGIAWETLQRVTELPGDALDASIERLLSAGLIDCNGRPHPGSKLRQGAPTFFWATVKAWRLLAERDTNVEREDDGHFPVFFEGEGRVAP